MGTLAVAFHYNGLAPSPVCYVTDVHGWKWTLIPEVRLGVECYSNLNHCINGQGIFTSHCVGAVISTGNNLGRHNNIVILSWSRVHLNRPIHCVHA